MTKKISKKFFNVWTSTPHNVEFIQRNKANQLVKADQLIRDIMTEIANKKSMNFNPKNAIERIANRIRSYYKDN